MAYRVNGKTFDTIDEYFDYMAESFDYTPYHHFFEKESVVSDGINLHVDVFTYDKNAPTVVLIPGTSLYSLCYVEMMYKIGVQGYNFVGFDPRGHGRSGGTKGDYTVSEIIKDAENVIEYARKKFNSKISVFGISQGGVAAFYLAAGGAKVQSVICQNFADLTDEKTMKLARHPNLSRYFKPLLVNFGQVFSDTQIPVNLYLNLENIKVKRFGNAKNFIDADPLALKTVSLRAIRSLTTTPIPNPIEEIKIPVMVFQGTNDSIFPLNYTQEIYDKLTCKKHFEIFEGMNHALVTDNVLEVMPSIVNWLKQIYKPEKKASKNKSAVKKIKPLSKKSVA